MGGKTKTKTFSLQAVKKKKKKDQIWVTGRGLQTQVGCVLAYNTQMMIELFFEVAGMG